MLCSIILGNMQRLNATVESLYNQPQEEREQSPNLPLLANEMVFAYMNPVLPHPSKAKLQCLKEALKKEENELKNSILIAVCSLLKCKQQQPISDRSKITLSIYVQVC